MSVANFLLNPLRLEPAFINFSRDMEIERKKVIRASDDLRSTENHGFDDDAWVAPKKMTKHFNRAAFQLSSLSIGNFRMGRRFFEGGVSSVAIV